MTIENQIAQEVRTQVGPDFEGTKQHITAQMALLLENVGQTLTQQGEALAAKLQQTVAEAVQASSADLASAVESRLADDFGAVPGAVDTALADNFLAIPQAVKGAIQNNFDILTNSLASAHNKLNDLKTLLETVAADVLAIEGGAATDLEPVLTQLNTNLTKLDALAVAIDDLDAQVTLGNTDILNAIATLEVAPAPTEPTEPVPSEPTTYGLVGMNIAGLGNNPQVQPGVLRTHYVSYAPTANGGVDFLASYDITETNKKNFLVRMPFAGERCFDISGSSFALRQGYIDQMLEVIRYVASRGGKVLLDMHNYCRWWKPTPKNADGSLVYPNAQRSQGSAGGVDFDSQWFPVGHVGSPVNYYMLAQMWAKLAEIFHNEEGVWCYGLMNEPHSRGAADLGVDVQAEWIANVQQIVNAVREVSDKPIAIGGCGYSTAKGWRSVSSGLANIVGDNIFFEAHQYPDMDGNGGGQWKTSVTHVIDPAARVADWIDFLDWCEEIGRPAIAGEFGCPTTYEKWTEDNFKGTFEGEYTVQGGAEYLEQIHALFDERKVVRFQWLSGPGKLNKYANGMDHADGTLKGSAAAIQNRLGTVTVASAADFGPKATA